MDQPRLVNNMHFHLFLGGREAINLKENYKTTYGEAWLGFFSVVFLLGWCYVIIYMPRVPTEMLADLKLVQ